MLASSARSFRTVCGVADATGLLSHSDSTNTICSGYEARGWALGTVIRVDLLLDQPPELSEIRAHCCVHLPQLFIERLDKPGRLPDPFLTFLALESPSSTPRTTAAAPYSAAENADVGASDAIRKPLGRASPCNGLQGQHQAPLQLQAVNFPSHSARLQHA